MRTRLSACLFLLLPLAGCHWQPPHGTEVHGSGSVSAPTHAADPTSPSPTSPTRPVPDFAEVGGVILEYQVRNLDPANPRKTVDAALDTLRKEKKLSADGTLLRARGGDRIEVIITHVNRMEERVAELQLIIRQTDLVISEPVAMLTVGPALKEERPPPKSK